MRSMMSAYLVSRKIYFLHRFHNAILKTCVMSAHMRKKHSNDVFQNQKLSFEVERIDYQGCIVTKKVAFVCKICHQCCLEHSSAVFISQNSSSYRVCCFESEKTSEMRLRVLFDGIQCTLSSVL